MDFGILSYAAIVVLSWFLGQVIKTSPLDNKWIPTICGAFGILLGIVAFATKIPDFPAENYLMAAAVGAVSGLTATGLNEAVKQLRQN